MREAVIRDPDAEAELREIELDLLDAAARGTLDPTRRKLVETEIVAAPHNREAWLLAQALAEREARLAQSPLQDSARIERVETRRVVVPVVSGVRSRWAVALPAAAVIVAAAGLTVFLLRGSTTSDRDSTTKANDTAQRAPGDARGAVPPTTPTPIQPAADPARDTTASARAKSDPGSKSGAATKGEPATTTNVVALFLPAATLRGGRPTVQVSPSTQAVRIDIEIEPPAPSRVNVMLRAIRGGDAPSLEKASATPWSASRVAVRTEDGQKIATIEVPATVLPTGAVEIVVTAADAPASGSASASAPRVYPLLVTRK